LLFFLPQMPWPDIPPPWRKKNTIRVRIKCFPNGFSQSCKKPTKSETTEEPQERSTNPGTRNKHQSGEYHFPHWLATQTQIEIRAGSHLHTKTHPPPNHRSKKHKKSIKTTSTFTTNFLWFLLRCLKCGFAFCKGGKHKPLFFVVLFFSLERETVLYSCLPSAAPQAHQEKTPKKREPNQCGKIFSFLVLCVPSFAFLLDRLLCVPPSCPLFACSLLKPKRTRFGTNETRGYLKQQNG